MLKSPVIRRVLRENLLQESRSLKSLASRERLHARNREIKAFKSTFFQALFHGINNLEVLLLCITAITVLYFRVKDGRKEMSEQYVIQFPALCYSTV